MTLQSNPTDKVILEDPDNTENNKKNYTNLSQFTMIVPTAAGLVAYLIAILVCRSFHHCKYASFIEN